MTKEFAALLAQVIPVLALANAIELRSLALRSEGRQPASSTITMHQVDPNDPLATELMGILALLLMVTLGFVQVVLAVLEVKVLGVAGERVFDYDSLDPFDFAVQWGVIFTFYAPVIDAATRAWSTYRKAPPSQWRRLGAAFLLVVVVMTLYRILDFFMHA